MDQQEDINYQDIQIFRSLIEESPLPIALYTGREMKIKIANRAMLETWGKDESVIGELLHEALPELENQPFSQILDKVYTTGIAYDAHEDLVKLIVGGQLQTFYYDFTYKPLKNPDGKTWGILNTATNVTELVLSKKRVEESEKRFKNLLLQAPVALCVLRGPSHIVEVANEGILEIWGKTREQVLNKPIFEGLPEAKGQGLEDLLNFVFTTGERFTAKERQVDLPRNGKIETTVINFVYEPFLEVDGTISGIMAAAIEVTEQVKDRKKVEAVNAELEETAQRLEIALEAGNLGSYELDFVKGTMDGALQFKKNLGLKAEDTLTFDSFLSALLPKYREDVQEKIKYAIDNGTVYHAEYEVYWPDGSIHWIRSSGKVQYDESGKPLIMTGVNLNITEQKQIEQQKDDFLGIASHELKTPLTSLKGSLQLLTRVIQKDPASDKVAGLLQQSNISLAKLNNLIKDLLNVTKISAGQITLNKTRFTISKMIEDCCNHVRMAGTHEIIIKGDKELQVYADSQRIDQVMINFVNNAVKYAPESTRIIAVIEKINNKAKVSVTDNGPGIPPDKLPHLFDRYYRVDSKGVQYSGLGLGLYISAEIIKRHGGEIGVNSTLGKGSTFWFTLPL